MVGFGHFHDNVFVRLVTINGENTDEDLKHFFNVLENFANENSDSIKRDIIINAKRVYNYPSVARRNGKSCRSLV